MRLLLAALALGLAAGCARAPDAGEVRTAIEGRNAVIEQAYSHGDAAAVAAAFVADGIQMPPNHAPLVGRAAIEQYWTPLMAAGHVQFSLNTQQVATQGDLAVERGTYTLRFIASDNPPAGLASFEDSGSYLVQWRREPDGQWRAVADAPVSQRPLPAGAPH